jgi:hypothetical protein
MKADLADGIAAVAKYSSETNLTTRACTIRCPAVSEHFRSAGGQGSGIPANQFSDRMAALT